MDYSEAAHCEHCDCERCCYCLTTEAIRKAALTTRCDRSTMRCYETKKKC